ncbi:GNAT family N-acetyltransferase [Hyalangium gracile]|uniref:GNAT family N-acetyltransferase n=1 Tax=Hyalangium gracile TaxID=394092 RepID=UPI001CCBA9CA|nr:GNAT family N-acetyltransferase [Hyalangium gracile]
MKGLDFAEIARLVERKQGTSLEGLATDVVPVAGGWMVFDTPGSPVNKVCGLGFHGVPTDAELDRMITFFTERGAEPKVELCPFVPRALMEGLGKRGFVLQEFENVLIRDLQRTGEIRSLLPWGWPVGVSIEKVDPTNPTLVDDYIRVAFSGFFPEGMELSEGLMDFGRRFAKARGYDLYVARVNGEVVGAAGCESGNDVTLLFGASVKPAFRRRGIQQALMATRLERGRELGSRLAMINSGPGISTERNATRLGFGVAYSRAVLVRPGEGLVKSS